jgi:hypothetical protein
MQMYGTSHSLAHQHTPPSAFLIPVNAARKAGARQGKKIKAMTYLAHHGRLNANVGYLRIRVILGSGVLEVVF